MSTEFGLTPAAVGELAAAGHDMLVETQAGVGIGSADEEYRRAGARIAQTAAEVFAQAELVVKVKEPQPVECAMLRRGQGTIYVSASCGRSGADP